MMDIVAAYFSGLWEVIDQIRPFGVPVIYILLVFVVMGAMVKFIKGKK